MSGPFRAIQVLRKPNIPPNKSVAGGCSAAQPVASDREDTRSDVRKCDGVGQAGSRCADAFRLSRWRYGLEPSWDCQKKCQFRSANVFGRPLLASLSITRTQKIDPE